MTNAIFDTALFAVTIGAGLGFWAGWVFGWAKGYHEGCVSTRETLMRYPLGEDKAPDVKQGVS